MSAIRFSANQTIKLFVLLICLACSQQLNDTICAPEEVQLFYENADNFTEWTWDADGSDFTSHYALYYEDYEYCSVGNCYWFAQDYGDFIANPSFLSPPISTIGYTNIYIVFDVFPWQKTRATAMCQTSYTVNGGTDSTLIDSAKVLEEDTAVRKKVNEKLGVDAANMNAIQIRLELVDNHTDITEPDWTACGYDEMFICATPITPSPTTSPTRSPTTESSESQSSESASASASASKSSDSDSDSSDQMMYAQNNKNQQDDDFVSIYNDKGNDKTIHLNLSFSFNTIAINVISIICVFSCIVSLICVCCNNNNKQ